MQPTNKHNDAINKLPMLTIEDLDAYEQFKNLSQDQKLELILLVYELSRALYHSYSNDDE